MTDDVIVREWDSHLASREDNRTSSKFINDEESTIGKTINVVSEQIADQLKCVLGDFDCPITNNLNSIKDPIRKCAKLNMTFFQKANFWANLKLGNYMTL